MPGLRRAPEVPLAQVPHLQPPAPRRPVVLDPQLVTATVCLAAMVMLTKRRPRMSCTRCRMYLNKHQKSCPFYERDKG